MTAQGDVRDSHSELKEAVASGFLTETLQLRAEDILTRIEKPVRLSLLGLPGSGKSTLMNLLMGAEVLPENVRLPTMRFSHGAMAEAVCTLADGSSKTIPGADMLQIAELGAAFVDVKLPLPALAKLTMLEVVMGPDFVGQSRAMQWAAKRTDLAMWCTKDIFGQNEQALWDLMPDEIQDNAFLMLTKADALAARGELGHRLEEVKASGQEFFRHVLPIGSKSAIAARGADGVVDKDALRASGGIALISAVLKAVEAGREVARDQATVFLRQIDYVPLSKSDQTIAEQVHQPKKFHETTILIEEMPAEPEIKQEAERDADTPEEASLADASREAVEQAIGQVTSEGQSMLTALQEATLTDGEVLVICADTVEWLASFLEENGEPNDPAMDPLRAFAVEGADLIQLIQLESGTGVAEDALSLMIQLKQDMQAALSV